VTFKYYVGVICFLEENYELVRIRIVCRPTSLQAHLVQAEENLTYAYTHCHLQAQRNKEHVLSPFTFALTKHPRRILTYLIPTRLLTSHKLPSSSLLAPYATLRKLFGPLVQCIRRGDLAGFDAALASHEDAFVRRRIYLTLERGRDVALRNLLRKVYIAGGFEESKDGGPALRRTRVPVAEFAAAIRLGARQAKSDLDGDEVECLIANMIYKVCACLWKFGLGGLVFSWWLLGNGEGKEGDGKGRCTGDWIGHR
jgi:COP9 signalosome complex subunit 12